MSAIQPFHYRTDITKKQMRVYAELWEGLPLPRLQLRYDPKPIAKSKRRTEIARRKRMCVSMGYDYHDDHEWLCSYELVFPVDKYDIRNDRYGVGFILIPISQTKIGGTRVPRTGDTPFRDGSHAFWDSKVLGWLPIYSVGPDGTAVWKRDYRDQPAEWNAPAPTPQEAHHD